MSPIYFDRRGRYVGKRAPMTLVPQDRSKSATLFKRLMGTTTPGEHQRPGSVTQVVLGRNP